MKVYWNVKIEEKNGQGPAREVEDVEVELFDDTTPEAAQAFFEACTTGKSTNTTLRRIWKDELCMGGRATNDIPPVKGVNFARKHSSAGVLSTPIFNQEFTRAPSQFYIFFTPYPWLDGRFLVFGQITDRSFLYTLSEAGSRTGRPSKIVTITYSGATKKSGV